MSFRSDFPPDTSHPPSHPALPTRQLVGSLALFVFAGIPLVALVWDALNRLTAGHIHPVRLVAGLVAIGLILVLFRLLARTVTRWEAHRFE